MAAHIEVREPAARRCPFASARIPRDAMAACPGYAAETLDDLSVAGRRLPNPGTCCAHLTAERRGAGRFTPACHHPEAARVTEAARAMLRREMARALRVDEDAADPASRRLTSSSGAASELSPSESTSAPASIR